MKSGIYKIVSKYNGKIYVGQSVNVRQRWSHHRHQLRNSKHCNSILQRTFNKHGEDNLVFEVIEYCSTEVLLERELFWVKELNALDPIKGFNIQPALSSPLGYKHTDEARQNMSKAALERYKQPKQKERQTEIMKDRWRDPAYRRKQSKRLASIHTPEHKAKLSALAKAQWAARKAAS